MLYIYDGTFDSLMNALSAALSGNDDVEDILHESCVAGLLFGENFNAGSDAIGAKKFCDAVENISGPLLASLCFAYLSELPGNEMLIYRMLKNVFDHGASVIDNPADIHTRKMELAVRKVRIECHRMQGLLRFSELSDGIYYAGYEPDHNITGLIVPHFMDRMNHDWIIHDIKRGIAAIRSGSECEIVSTDIASALEFSMRELEFRKLWQRYYKEIAIPKRKNPSCQRRFMPKRYWKYLTERME